MKRYFILLVLFFSVIGCSKDEPDTSLEITAIAGTPDNFNFVDGASVKLFQAQANGSLGSPVGTGTTDGDGRITFTGLQPVSYTWSIEKGCIMKVNNNIYEPYGPLERGILNRFTVNVPKIGYLDLVNNSANNITVITGLFQTFPVIVDAQSNEIVPFGEGEHIIRHYPSNNQALQKEKIINIQCGDTTTVIL